MFVTGAAVQWLRDGLGIVAEAAETEGMAASLESNDDVYFVPALTGLGSPHWDPYARGTIVGLTRGTTRAHLARAALEGIAYQTVDAVRAQERVAGEQLSELRADGGAVANRWLMQFQADVLGAPVIVPAIAETTAPRPADRAVGGVRRDRVPHGRVHQRVQRDGAADRGVAGTPAWAAASDDRSRRRGAGVRHVRARRDQPGARRTLPARPRDDVWRSPASRRWWRTIAKYVMPIRPFTIAMRLQHVGRYGRDASDPRLLPFVWYVQDTVRGFDGRQLPPHGCSVATVGCEAIDAATTERLLAANFEVRFPLLGLRHRTPSYGRLPLEGLIFSDTGAFWTSTPASARVQTLLRSVGAGVRVNAGGLIFEFDAARPIGGPARGWRLSANFRPGF